MHLIPPGKKKQQIPSLALQSEVCTSISALLRLCPIMKMKVVLGGALGHLFPAHGGDPCGSLSPCPAALLSLGGCSSSEQQQGFTTLPRALSFWDTHWLSCSWEGAGG